MSLLLTQSLLLAFFVSLLTTPLVIKIFRDHGWLDNPQKHHHPKVVHQKPVPRGGGIPILLAILVTSLVFLPLDKHLVVILLAAFLATLVGTIDDIKEVNPYWRLLTNLLVAGIILGGGIGIDYITNPFDTVVRLDQIPLLKVIFTLFWIVWCMNIIGWSGGVDGQLPGFVAISAIIIGLLSLRFSQDIAQWPVISLSGAVAGSYLGFLVFNAYPQQIMPGYSGKSLAGLMLAVLAIFSGAKVATAILVLAVPMIDGAITIIRRLAQKKLPFWGDAEHFHHLLLKLGVHKAKIALLYWIFSLILGIIVLNLNSKQKFYFLAMTTILVGLLIWIVKTIVARQK